MPRVKRGTTHVARRKRLLSKTKGYKWGRKKLVRAASTAVNKAGQHAYKSRKQKKRDNRRTWMVQLNAAVRQYDLSYSKFIDLMKKKKIEADRKVLSQLARTAPEAFGKFVETIKK